MTEDMACVKTTNVIVFTTKLTNYRRDHGNVDVQRTLHIVISGVRKLDLNLEPVTGESASAAVKLGKLMNLEVKILY